jgi:hypothetical protein
MKKGIYILGHQGIGDHILCSGIYREYAKRYKHCVIPVYGEKVSILRDLLKDVENMQLIFFKSELWEMKMQVHRNLLRFFGYDSLNLGHHGKNFFRDPDKRLDENYYLQAGIPLEARWNSFNYVRNIEKEIELYNLMGCADQEYIFVHDDISRNFCIDESRLPKGIKIIRPDMRLAKKFSFFDYIYIIENAYQIHVMESSFGALIESLVLDVPKFAHRYARPEAKSDFRHEFTYKSNWKVLL